MSFSDGGLNNPSADVSATDSFNIPLVLVEESERREEAPPSPANYRRVATTSQVDSIPLQSPPYNSQPVLGLSEMNNVNVEEKLEKRVTIDEKVSAKVHYPADIPKRPQGLGDLPRFVSRDGESASVAGTDDEYEDEKDYDWSAEEDLVEEEARFEQKIGLRKVKKGWGIQRVVTFLFSSLIGSVILASLLVAGPILVHFYWYKKDPTEHRRYVLDNVEAWLFWAASNLLISWWLALLIDLVPIVALSVISIGWGHVSEKNKNLSELYNGIKGTIKPPFYAASGWVSWVILFEVIYGLYDANNEGQSRARYTPRVYQVVRFLFFFVLVVSVQRLLSQAVALSFHRTAFNERLDDVSKALHAIETLRNYKPVKGHHTKKISDVRTPVFGSPRTPQIEKEKFNFPSRLQSAAGSLDLERDVQVQAEAVDAGPSTKGKRKSGFWSPPLISVETDSSAHQYPPKSSATHEKSGSGSPLSTRTIEEHDNDAVNMVTHAAKVLKTAVLHDARNITGQSDADDGLVWSVSNSREAKRLARLIYDVFHDRRRRFLIPEDFHPAFPSTEEAQNAFRVFDKDNNGDISRQDIKSTLMKVYKERRFLSRSMRDVSAALQTLDRLLLFLALIVLLFISLSVFAVNVGTSLTSVYSLGLAASFVFKTSASNAFDAIMFLFVTHPFDTGDRCFIGLENLVVKKMGLFATTFQRADGTETYYFNSQLFNLFINNARRSEKTFENLTMQVAWRTPLEKLDALITALNEWLETEENRWFAPSTSLTLQRIDFQRFLECTILIGHNGNWQDWNLRLARKTAFHAAVQYYCQQLGIVTYNLPQPIVYADRETQRYDGPSQLGKNPIVPPSPYAAEMSTSAVDLTSQVAKGNANLLGFQLPSSHKTFLRARKSKGRKAMLSNNM